MTLPNERRRSINMAREFLRSLLDPKMTPRIPKDIRRKASAVLRHFPSEYHMDEAQELAPKLFGNWND